MVTMAEIDAARGKANQALARLRSEQNGGTPARRRQVQEEHRAACAAVDVLLRQWWLQDCHEAGTPLSESDLLAEREKMLALLREVEWSGVDDDEHCCPICGECQDAEIVSRTPMIWETRGKHTPDCRLAAFLIGTDPT